MFRKAYSLGPDDHREELFMECREHGIECVEISNSYLSQAENVDFVKMAEFAKRYGVELWSYHLPFGPFEKLDISSRDKEVWKFSLETQQEYIRKASAVGIKTYVIHPSGEPIADEERSERMKWAQENLSKLAETAHRCGGTVAVEDLPRTCLGRNSDEILKLISADERLRVCFDANHLLKEDNVDFIRKVGSKIVTTHISDYDFINERHWLPGEGKNDWQAIIAALKEIGYSGPWLYEIRFECPKTIIRPRNLCIADFALNAEELFAGKKPTVFSTPIENLGMW